MSIFTIALISFLFSFESSAIQHAENSQYNNDMLASVNQFSVIKKKAEYNTWANLQIANWLKQADSAQWNKSIESSFSTLELTIRHLWNAEYAWLTTLKNEVWRSVIEKDELMDCLPMLDGFINTSRAFQQYVQNMQDADFMDTRKIGKDGVSVTLVDIIEHVFNHATYHRGQLITMGRQVGLGTPPRTDYIYFLSK
jgi:uncharacterized damage-inducible protein DinB